MLRPLFVLVLVLAWSCISEAIPQKSRNQSASTSTIGLKGVGGRLGYVSPENLDGTFDFGIVVDLGTLIEQLAWDASLEYWSSSDEGSNGPNTSYKNSISDIALRSGMKYLFPMDKLRLFAGGGFGFHMYMNDSNANYSYGPYSHYSDSDVANEGKFGIYLQGGVETDLSAKWKGAVDGRLDFVDDANQTHIMFTAIYMLGK